jgi:creatinine amidohydrolase/Fe(II)-dependent formamide hydrolase-like protein
MTQHTRRDVLLAGLALPGIAGAFGHQPVGDHGSLKPKRFEETAGFEVPDVVAGHPNGHDGNIGAGRGAIAQIADEAKDTALLFASWWEFLPSEVMKALRMFHQANGGHGHGGPLETSAVAALRPDLIHLSKAHDLPEPPDLSGGAPYFLQKSTATNWPGYSGQVSEASAEKGKRLVEISEEGIVKLIENWLKHDEVPGSW